MRALAALALVALSIAPAARAHAQHRTSQEEDVPERRGAEPAEFQLDPPILDVHRARARPDYDGREDRPATFGEGLLWIPRIVFFPVHAVFEYLLRAPIGWLVTEIERNQILALLFDFFTWEERKAGLVPTFLFDFGFQPSVGLYFFWNDFPVARNDVRVWGGLWGFDWLHLTVLDRIHIDPDHTTLHLVFDALKRPDFIYNGEGPDVVVGDESSRYSRESLEGYALLEHDFWRASRLSLEVGIRRYEFGDTTFADHPDDPVDDQPSVPEAVDQGIFDRYPTSFLEGYTGVHQRIQLAVDTRKPRPAPGTGVRLVGWGELGWDASDIVARRWFSYGGVLGLFLDVGHQRVVGLSAGTELVDPVGTLRGAAGVPFTELVEVNDLPNVVSGYLPGSLRGRSVVGLTLNYTYPIWVWLEGTVHVNVGNAFGEQFEDFAWDKLRLWWGIGIRTISERDSAFSFEVAFGTDTFEQGTNVSSVRIVFGVVSGF